MPDKTATGTTAPAPANKKKAKVKRDKRAAFLRLANKRTKSALKRLRQIRALANRAAYDYTDAEAAKIVTALAKAVEDVDKAFEKRLVMEDEFTL